jgi:hypothetical protein
MNDETRDQVVALLTRIGMMAEDLSAIALGAVERSNEELAGLVWEIQRRELAIKVLGEEAASIAFIGHP